MTINNAEGILAGIFQYWQKVKRRWVLNIEFLLLHQTVEVGELHGEGCSPLTGGAQ
jgi:hypothetical protein